MKDILYWVKSALYLGVITRCFAIIGFFILRRQKRKDLKIFELYIIVYILYVIPYLIAVFFEIGYQLPILIFQLTEYLFTVFEFFVFFLYIKNLLEGFANKSTTRLLSAIYVVVSLVALLIALITTKKIPFEVIQYEYIIQAAC